MNLIRLLFFYAYFQNYVNQIPSISPNPEVN